MLQKVFYGAATVTAEKAFFVCPIVVTVNQDPYLKVLDDPCVKIRKENRFKALTGTKAAISHRLKEAIRPFNNHREWEKRSKENRLRSA